MKKLLLFLFVSLFIISCSSDSESDLQEDDTEMTDEGNGDDSGDNGTDDGSGDDSGNDGTDGSTAKLTYTADIAPIISSNCLNCHGATTRNGAPTSFNTFELVSSAATRMDSRMNNANNPMPASGLISQDLRDEFKQWITDGKLE